MTEGGIDYNAGLVGALAYIVSKLSPADTSEFKPNFNISGAKYQNIPKGEYFIHAYGDLVKIGSSQGIRQCTIYNLNGSTIYSSLSNTAEVYWNTTNAIRGLYLISLQLKNGTKIHSSVIVR